MDKILELLILLIFALSISYCLEPEKKCTCEYDVISIKSGKVLETFKSDLCYGSYSDTDVFREATLYYKMKNKRCK